MEYRDVIGKLKSMSDLHSVKGMAKFGINTKNALGISIPSLRKLAKEIGKNHSLAQELWSSEIHEARILASIIDDPKKVTEKQMERWVKEFESWDLCDQCCNNLFIETEFAYSKAFEFSSRRKEFVKRAGFVLMAVLAVHDKEASDERFEQFFPIIKREANDDRKYVRKAVNWALRQIGKRNPKLNEKSIKIAKEIKEMDSKSAQWIAQDALRELKSKAVQRRLKD